MKYTGLLFCFCFFIETCALAQVTLQKNSLVLENRAFSKTIHFSKTKAGAIDVASLTDKVSGEELLAASKDVPWFEFVVDHKLITSSDPLWQFQQYHTREMDNGGQETTLDFVGKKGTVKGLELEIVEQYFPNSTLVREQLTLKTEGGKSFPLNKLDGRLYFVFPQYSFKTQGNAQSTEIRLAHWGGEVLDSLDNSSYDDRRFDHAKYNNLSQAHMFHPQVKKSLLNPGTTKMLKGPIGIVSGGKYAWFTAYEHASQDNLADPAIVKGTAGNVASGSKIVVDEKQGAGEAEASEEKENERLHFLGIGQKALDGKAVSSVNILRGGYLDGERITRQKPYSTVWTATAFYPTTDADQPRQLMHNYLLKWICENQAAHKPEFYYNTWGMERDMGAKGHDMRGVMTYGRIFKEIDRAAELGVDIFVLDDGWEETMGVWTPNHKRLKDGLKPIYDHIKAKGMTMGVWLSPLGIDSTAQRFKDHPEWVIRDENGKPVPGQWDQPVFDFVSGFKDVFVKDCKRLIDQGVRFFKWDAINTFYPYATKALHGDGHFSKEEVIARYGYLLPIFMKQAMAELTAYKPGVVIEIDLTEDRRCLVGLAVLSEGKVFWMNNGASGYGDYSQYRAKSMRTVANEYAGIVPLQLFTYANYPMNAFPFFAQRYNVNSSLIAGRGFWGNLELTSEAQRLRVGAMARKAKRVLPYIGEMETQALGSVGASPEIYTTVNADTAAGQAIAFSGSAMNYDHRVKLNPQNFLAVLNNGYSLEDGSLAIHFQFPTPDATREAFILPNHGTGISIKSSTSWLDDVQLSKANALRFTVGAPGKQSIFWPAEMGEPHITATKKIKSGIEKSGERYVVTIETAEGGTEVRIDGQ